MIAYTCPSCGSQLIAPEEQGGETTHCPSCNTLCIIPLPSIRSGETLATAHPEDDGASSPSAARTLPRVPIHGMVPGYEILTELGRGGMGVVYKALQTKLHRLVALKMILAGGHAGERELARFHLEAEAIARLQHPNIVQVYEVGEHDGRPFLALEFCAGGSLEKKLHGTPWPPREAAKLVETLARAIHAAHRAHVVHRDLKPANVLLTADDTPKITDFGLAKKLDADAAPTVSGAVMGTPSYMSPEQAGGVSRMIGPWTDVYALGAILYELLTGRPPFKSAETVDVLLQVVNDEPVPPVQRNAKVSRDLETICLKCLQKDSSKRYAGADALAEDLARFQAGLPVQARRAGRLERGWRWCRRNPAVASLLTVLAGLLLLLVVGATVALRPRFQGDDNNSNDSAAGKDGWVRLFNGKDLSGWRTHPEQLRGWKVENGILIGNGPPSHLFSERGDYENFHFRVVAKINENGNSGQYCRCEFGLNVWGNQPLGYKAQIANDTKNRGPAHTGSLVPFVKVTDALIQPDEWFTQEVIVNGNHILINVNGKTTVDYVDEENTYTKGHLALQVIEAGSIVQFREIEVKELPPSPPEEDRGWVQLFNGKDLTGWKLFPGDRARWKVKDGVLTCAAGKSYLFSERGDYADFRFRVEARADKEGNSGQFFRAAFGPKVPLGYEAQIFNGEWMDGGAWQELQKTGSLFNVQSFKTLLVKPQDWFTQEVIARDNHIVIKVNGRTTVDFLDEKRTYRKGHLALQQFGPADTVAFRKVELKEFPRR